MCPPFRAQFQRSPPLERVPVTHITMGELSPVARQETHLVHTPPSLISTSHCPLKANCLIVRATLCHEQSDSNLGLTTPSTPGSIPGE